MLNYFSPSTTIRIWKNILAPAEWFKRKLVNGNNEAVYKHDADLFFPIVINYECHLSFCASTQINKKAMKRNVDFQFSRTKVE